MEPQVADDGLELSVFPSTSNAEIIGGVPLAC